MLYDCKTNNQSQKRCTMDSFKEKDKLALKPSKRPRIEVDEEMVRRIIAGLAPLDSPVVRRIPEPKEEDTDASEENTSETPSEAPVSTASVVPNRPIPSISSMSSVSSVLLTYKFIQISSPLSAMD